MTNAFAEMLASQMRVFLQNEGCPLHELEERFRRHLGMDLSTEQEASFPSSLIEVTGQSRYLEELKPASILRRKQDRWYFGRIHTVPLGMPIESHLLSKPAWRSAIDSIDKTYADCWRTAKPFWFCPDWSSSRRACSRICTEWKDSEYGGHNRESC